MKLSMPAIINIEEDQLELLVGKIADEVVKRLQSGRYLRVEDEAGIGQLDRMGRPEDLPLILTIKEAASYLKRSTKTVRSRVGAGQIKSYREGNQFRIRKEWLLEYEATLISERSLNS